MWVPKIESVEFIKSKFTMTKNPNAPWCWIIYLHLPSDVGEYSSTMVRIWEWILHPSDHWSHQGYWKSSNHRRDGFNVFSSWYSAPKKLGPAAQKIALVLPFSIDFHEALNTTLHFRTWKKQYPVYIQDYSSNTHHFTIQWLYIKITHVIYNAGPSVQSWLPH